MEMQGDLLKENLDPERGREERRRAGGFWREPLRALMSFLSFAALFPVGLAAQTTPTVPAPAQAAVYGSGIQTPLRFEGEPKAANQVSFNLGASAFYDDNVLARNSQSLGDEAVSFDSHLGITKESQRVTASFDYMPFFLLYRTFDQYDRLNHSGNLNLEYKLTSRVILGLHDGISYETGNYASLTGQQILSGPSSATALNQTVIPYTTRTLSNMSGLDLTFLKSRRTSLTLSGGYNQRKFGKQTAGQPLYNSNGASGSLQFQYRVTEHTSFGILLLHQDTTYQGSGIFGNRPRAQVESTFLSVGSRLSPTVTMTVFGGPEYVRTIGQVSAGAGLVGHFQGCGGGSITKEVRKTALDLSFQRSVSDGGGLYTSAISTNATLGLRRRLVGHWEVDCRGGAARADTSLFHLANGRTDVLTGRINISRPFSHGSVFHISYDSTHQLSKGTLPISADLDRNQVAAGIDYQFKAFSLAR
jgi:hypothetical protein